MDSFDLIVVGAGPGGYVAAIRAAQLGSRVALVDKEPVLGGTCLRVGCIPSKALLEASELYHGARHRLGEFGISVAESDVHLELETMMARKDRIVDELTGGIGVLMKKHGVTVLCGRGTLKGDGVVEVAGAGETTALQGRAILLATGSEPIELPGMPFDGDRIVTSTEALAFDRVPEHLVVIGAGAVGLELGSVWCRLGAQVTVVELLPQIVPFADKQIAQLMLRALKQQGMTIQLSARVEGATVAGERVEVTVRAKDDEVATLSCDRLLVAVGRKPYTGGLGLDGAGVRLDPRGGVEVDDGFRTSVAGIYAIGDLIRGPMLAHKAEDEGIAVAELLAGKAGHVNYDVIPSVVYTTPELAQVGLTEAQVKERKIEAKTGRFYFKANGRAKCHGLDDGMVKIIADAKTDRLLGVHILGPHASELIAEAVTAMEFGGSAEDLARTVHAHPTLSEAVKEAAMNVERRAIHG
ncbi:MAG: dihydrolipoyl dehydrogenase [Deltaproteobacteria bacterium]|jgi:dihydrolipoamide dehydrogenase|nr:dihydrolipoyl dehydrogenase [Deltaproteobacteria bacterium]MBW2534264.1 dihydrolipoyl dehydrogenase [Deltaproteobacteria bacterium]